MTRSGKEYVDGLRDGRAVFIDGEKVDDVTTHPAFAGTVRSVAMLYDIANDPANRDTMTFPSPSSGEPVNRAFIIPRTKDELAARRTAIERWARATVGYMGRSPDHVASFLSAFAGSSELFAEAGREFGENVVAFHEFARDNDKYVTYTIVPPQIDRSKAAHEQEEPHLYAGVKEERDGGIVIKGAQMLGTGTAVSDWVFLSCIQPLRPGEENQAISCVIPVGAPGVKVYSRRSYAKAATSTYDYPLSSRFDETDSLLVFDDVFVPWEHVFVYRDIELTRRQFFETAAHALGNNQAQIRFATKLHFIAGLAKRVTQMNGVYAMPPVQATLAQIAGHAAVVRGLVDAQEARSTVDSFGILCPAHAPLYANMMLQSSVYPEVLDLVRDLCGGGLIQLPSSVADYAHPEISEDLQRYVRSPGTSSKERVKLLKLVWDAVGSEFASRHHQYEMFYAGAPFIVKGHMFRQYDFASADELVDEMLASYDMMTGRPSADRAGRRVALVPPYRPPTEPSSP